LDHHLISTQTLYYKDGFLQIAEYINFCVSAIIFQALHFRYSMQNWKSQSEQK